MLSRTVGALDWDGYVARNLAAILSYCTRKSKRNCREVRIDDILSVQKRMMSADYGELEAQQQIEIDSEARYLTANALLKLAEGHRSCYGRYLPRAADMFSSFSAYGALDPA